MCSVDEDDLDGEKFMEEAPSTTLENETCKKCRSQKATLTLRKKDHYCDECFTASINHKFRSTFGKSRLIKPGDKVLIAHSGDADSSALIHLIHLGISEDTHKKLKFQPVVLHIDEGSINNTTNDERRTIISDIESRARSYNIPFHSICMSQTMAENVQLSDDNLVTDQLETQLKQLISTTNTQTARRSMLKKLKKNLLLQCSKILDCSHVLLAETATTLAANLLASVAFGSGPHISSDIGFSDTRDETVKILRPLKDLTSEDINLYNKIHNLSHSVNKDVQDGQYASIQSLTEHFIKNLQDNFPATVSTVMKTGDKIENSTTETKDDQQCAMCQSKLDTQISICSSAEATLFSKETSNETMPHINLTEQGQNCSSCTCGSTGTKSLTREDINLFMCYSCRLIIRDIKNVDFLPPTLLTNIKNKKRLQKIKNSIQDYLL